jgi:DNA-binding SARP family transcriptional activator
MAGMRVRLLGRVDVLVDATVREVPGLRRKAVLAALALQPGEVVSTDRLIDVVWGDEPPANTLATLHNHMSRLRTVLGDRNVILRRGHGRFSACPGGLPGSRDRQRRR